MSKDLKVVPLTKELFNQFLDSYTFSVGEDYHEALQGYFDRSLYSYVFLDHGAPIGCFGLFVMWPGVGECWFLSSPEINRYPITLVKAFKTLTDQVIQKGFHRVQILVHNKPYLHKWAKALGFHFEGILAKYGIDKKDNAIYAKYGS